jgi:hypothetical protein
MEPATPAPSVDTDRHTSALADSTNLDVVEIDEPNLAM